MPSMQQLSDQRHVPRNLVLAGTTVPLHTARRPNRRERERRMLDTFWKRCSTCKRGIGFGAAHWTCSVSTCNRKGNAFVFCSVSCWNAHVPTMRHRESWAEEQRSPTREAWAGERERSSASLTGSSSTHQDEPRRTEAAPAPTSAASKSDAEPPSSSEPLARDFPREILIVASKLKSYVRARSGMN